MTVTLPPEAVQATFAQRVLQAWHEAHGADAGHARACWGEDRVIVMIEDALCRGEQLLAASDPGNPVLDQYVHELVEYVATTQTPALSALLPREIESTSISVSIEERWVLFVFRLAA